MIPYDAICSWRNLVRASHQARRGRRGTASVAAHEYRLEADLIGLHDGLVSETYRPGVPTSFYIHDPKRRLITAAPMRDRVVHHALCNVLEPVFERTFVAESFANRRGKGTHAALDHCQRLMRRHRFALPCDVRQFFPSIDHALLKRILFTRIPDPRSRRLVSMIIDAGAGVLDSEYDPVWFPGDDLFGVCRPRGLPIGNLTSQIWANCYLSQFDHFVKRELRCAGYVRYVDDFILFADDKRVLWDWKRAIVERLAALRLTMHEGAHPRPVAEGIPFLGFIVFPRRRRLKRRNAAHFARSLRRAMATGETSTERLEARIRGWIAHASHGNTVGLRKSILAANGLCMNAARALCHGLAASAARP
ncbi:MAG: RNA-directed DNA polymerase [Phycisphaerales bacterium]